MGEGTEIARVRLPANMQADDVLSLCDQMKVRMAAVVVPVGPGRRKHDAEEGGVALPAGVKPVTKLPEVFAGAWGRFEGSVGELAKLRATRGGGTAEAGGEEITASDANIWCDECMRIVESWSDDASRLRDDGEQPPPSEAGWLHDAVFPQPEGLRFINARPRRQWEAMKPRMTTLASDRAQAVIVGFGGVRHYKQLVKAHEAFGRAFGFLAVTKDEEEVGDTRPEFAAAKESLRVLVRKIDAYADPDIPGSEALAAFLLRPYVELVAELGAAASRQPKKATTPAEPEPEPTGKG